jgi:hypothetical protein
VGLSAPSASRRISVNGIHKPLSLCESKHFDLAGTYHLGLGLAIVINVTKVQTPEYEEVGQGNQEGWESILGYNPVQSRMYLDSQRKPTAIAPLLHVTTIENRKFSRQK